ncbi:MAG: bifunctional riboflavin kinase/FAD synthetase [Syntrophales bacterium]|nr:bifunctional riboflavin kinase/FAD synthetase [Syntrophales bacterium]
MMRVIRSVDHIPAEMRNSIVTIGNFDGVHRGHRLIFKTMIEEARPLGDPTVVITFDPHPKKVIHPERRPFFLLTPLEEKLGLIESCGVDAVLVIGFDQDFAETTAHDFVNSILWEGLHLKKLFIGYDYSFGKGRVGNAAFLKEQGKRLGFAVHQVEAVSVGDTVVSSTNIRLSILDGDVRLVSRMLGRYYDVRGTVVKGYRRGTGMGFPTANIASEKVIPRVGVYVIYAVIDHRRYEGVLNIGFNPTFGDNQLSIEGHLFDFQGDIYGKDVTILFVERLRDEMKFPGPTELAEQISRDILRGKEILARESSS